MTRLIRASRGWVDGFRKRNEFSVRRKTTTAQKHPVDMSEKIVSFILYVSHVKTKYGILPKDIISMDETNVWFDCVCGTTVDTVGTKTINIKTTGHEKAHCSVILAARGDGTNLAPYIVFKGNIRKVRSMSETPGAFVSSSKNGWFNNQLTEDWLLKALGGQTLESRRLLVWDNYRCHIFEEVKQYVKLLNVGMAVVPGGCTMYIQAPDVDWNKGFKDKMTEYYDEWIANDENKEYIRSGNVKAVSIEILTDWVRKAWESISFETIQNSVASCALTVALDGSEDFKIHCHECRIVMEHGKCWQNPGTHIWKRKESSSKSAKRTRNNWKLTRL